MMSFVRRMHFMSASHMRGTCQSAVLDGMQLAQ